MDISCDDLTSSVNSVHMLMILWPSLSLLLSGLSVSQYREPLDVGTVSIANSIDNACGGKVDGNC
jgi:hypothetical protein